jgi:LAO/AO transport system kinase
MTLLDRFLSGDIRALSRLISHVENRRNGYQELLGRLYPRVGKTLRLGITGPPGAGKSTLVNGLTSEFHRESGRVGVIAVDPTSPFTGGALLGDRVRMNDLPTDGSVYFRSMATRGATGGLAGATDNVAILYDAFGFDITLIETVGVGQVELDIIDTCDTVVVVMVPESGDAVQTLKAGLMEIADIFCINKSDRPGADRLAADLKQTLDTRNAGSGNWMTPVVLTEAVNNLNIDQLHQAIVEHVDFCREGGQFEKHRRDQLCKKVLSILKHRLQSELLNNLSARMQLDSVIEDILSGKTNPFRVGEELYRQVTKSGSA